jgi:hypothetical protein
VNVYTREKDASSTIIGSNAGPGTGNSATVSALESSEVSVVVTNLPTAPSSDNTQTATAYNGSEIFALIGTGSNGNTTSMEAYDGSYIGSQVFGDDNTAILIATRNTGIFSSFATPGAITADVFGDANHLELYADGGRAEAASGREATATP